MNASPVINVASLILGGIAAGLVLLGWVGYRLWRRLVLWTAQPPGPGDPTQERQLEKLIGREGIARTPLRPIGVIQIGDHRYDVAAEGEYIPAGARVRVVAVQGRQILVRAVESLPKQEGEG